MMTLHRKKAEEDIRDRRRRPIAPVKEKVKEIQQNLQARREIP
jgi:hypothetical protein